MPNNAGLVYTIIWGDTSFRHPIGCGINQPNKAYKSGKG
jgi:hypothetical protein